MVLKPELPECPDCLGWGFVDHNVAKQCNACGGKGRVSKTAYYKKTGMTLEFARKRAEKRRELDV